MDVEELAKESQAQRKESQKLRCECEVQGTKNQMLRNDLAKALESLE